MTSDSSISQRVAAVLAAAQSDVVDRSAIRAELPRGATRAGTISATARLAQRGTGGGHNAVSKAFKAALWQFERRGWVRRESLSIVIEDRTALAAYAALGPDRYGPIDDE